MKQTTPTPTRWMGVGQATDDAPDRAGSTAAEAALLGRAAKLVIVFCSERYDLPALLGGVRTQSGDAELIGCSTAGEIATSGASEAGVVVLALGGEGFSIQTALATGAASDLHGAGATAASCMAAIADRPHRVLLLLTDGLAGDQQEVVRRLFGGRRQRSAGRRLRWR